MNVDEELSEAVVMVIGFGTTMLRTGLALFAWLLSYAYIIHIIGPYAGTCTQGDDSPHLAAIAIGPMTLLLSAVAIWVAKAPFLRWLVIPHLALAAVAAPILFRYLGIVTIYGAHICFATGVLASSEPLRCHDTGCVMLWHRAFAPALFAGLGALAASAVGYWRRARRSSMSRTEIPPRTR